MSTPEEIQAQADEIGWFHSIDLGNGVRTKGHSTIQMRPDQMPDFKGRTVLDIGAWDGLYSFMAEKEGASAITALDHYAWGVDIVARTHYWDECAAKGVLPDQARDLTDFWHDDLPWRRGFEFAQKTLDSKVEPYLADFTTTDLTALGTFDVVLYLGVLYHMKEPLTCLERLRSVTKEVAVVETEAIHIPGHEGDSLLQFYAGGDLNIDYGNWYVPNMTALHALCRAAGFSSIRNISGPPTPPPVSTALPRRLKRRAGRLVHGTAVPASVPYRAIVHAYV